MPPAPKVGNGSCKVWPAKVFRQIYSQHLPASYCHQRIAGKVGIYLQCIKYAGQQERGTAMLGYIAINGIYIYAQSVGKTQLNYPPLLILVYKRLPSYNN